MKAVIVRKPGDAKHLTIADTADPVIKPDELLVRVKATALNRADILQRKGLYPPPKGTSPILGLEFAGTVEKTGENCNSWKAGDHVFGLLPGGGYAELAVINHQMAIKIPENLSFEAAAAIPEAFLTAYQGLFWLGKLLRNEMVLIHAGASGVGTAAIQLARECGAKIFVTAGSANKLNVCQELGANWIINYREGSFLPVVMKATNRQGVSLIIDFIGKPYWKQNLTALATDGRLVFLGLMGGSEIENFDLRIIMKKRLSVFGSSLRNRPLDYKIRLTREFSDFALPLFSNQRLKPVIDSIFSWKDISTAHKYMEANRNIGKIVLKIESLQ